MLRFWVHIPWKGMMKINEKSKIINSLNELEEEFKKGNIPKNHYGLQKKQLNQRLDALEAAERVMRLQGKKTVETPVDTKDDSENDALFKKFITSPGLKKKKLDDKDRKGFSQNNLIAISLLIIAFVIGIGFGIYALGMPSEVSSVSLSTNDSAFPPYAINNNTNTTIKTNSSVKQNTSKINTSVSQETQTTSYTPTVKTNNTTTNTQTGAAGEPGSKNNISQ